MESPSTFLEPGSQTSAGSLAIIQLSRDNLVPLILKETADLDDYAEGPVLNTRFGSFPHSTLIGVPWGSQVRASRVDTGARGRKRKRNGEDGEDEESKVSTPAVEDTENSTPAPAPLRKAPIAPSGFIHVLRPTPELWTQSLPHRTQVVYTPDYSYILQRIRARPGVRLIEAGAGSGSFTHASVRAVYNGYPQNAPSATTSTGRRPRRGQVFSFEYNESRYRKMQQEIEAHHLEGLVHLTHRDVYNGGFLLDDGKSPQAESIFLDLPAPWEALPRLSRRKPTGTKEFDEKFRDVEEWVSPLHPKRTAYICTFSPCIEQVMRTVTVMRQLGWVEIDMVEISHKKINISRERVFSQVPAERKAPPDPSNVQEAVARLREIERRSLEHTNRQNARARQAAVAAASTTDSPAQSSAMDIDESGDSEAPQKHAPRSGAPEVQSSAPAQPRLVHRPEPEVKTHTSYLVFATLPREWSEEEEAVALAKWPCGSEKGVIGSVDKATRKREKTALLAKKSRDKANKKNGKEQPAATAAAPTTD